MLVFSASVRGKTSESLMHFSRVIFLNIDLYVDHGRPQGGGQE